MKKIFLFSFLVLSGLTVYSQQSLNDELEAAGQITSSTERLEAYDRILEKHGIRTPAEISGDETGEWITSVDTDPITDNKIIRFFLEASSGADAYSSPIMLVIRWNNGEVDMYINWRSYLGSSIDVTFRIGDDTPETMKWNLSTDSRASFYPHDPLPTIKRLLEARRAVARCTPYNHSPITAIFDLTGLKALATKYNNDLKWF